MPKSLGDQPYFQEYSKDCQILTKNSLCAFSLINRWLHLHKYANYTVLIVGSIVVPFTSFSMLTRYLVLKVFIISLYMPHILSFKGNGYTCRESSYMLTRFQKGIGVNGANETIAKVIYL